MQDTNSVFGLVTLILGAIGAALLIAAFLLARTPGKSDHWPTTTGQILTSAITYRRGSRGSRTPYPVVVYAYQVEGKQYQSRRIYFGGVIGGSLMTGLIKKYPVGAQVPVRTKREQGEN